MTAEFDAWKAQGERNGWLTAQCFMHDWIYTQDEVDALEDGDDPCIPRLVVTPPPPPPAEFDPNQQTLFGEA